MLAGMWAFQFNAILSEVIGIPCFINMLIYLHAVSLMSVCVTSRAMVISLETQFSQSAKKMRVMRDSEAEDDSSQSTPRKRDFAKNTLHSTGILFRAAFGCVKIEKLAFREVKGALDSYWLFAVVGYAPGMLVWIISLWLGRLYCSYTRFVCFKIHSWDDTREQKNMASFDLRVFYDVLCNGIPGM
jgi:hypothetical protein